MREIKFRCWIDYGPGHCTMLYDRGNLSEFFDAADGSPTMQYTGLKDATKWEDLTEEERKKWVEAGNLPSQWNGKEIYEGDILAWAGDWCRQDKEERHVVKFGFHSTSDDYYASVAYGFYMEREDLKVDTTHSGEYFDKCEVIGNIYENPELLEEKNEKT